jgi:hypothetical protein
MNPVAPVHAEHALAQLAHAFDHWRHSRPNRAATAIKLLFYDGQGCWLCTKRLSQGRFQWWPCNDGVRGRLSARELLVLLWHGLPPQAQMAQDWRPLPSGGTRWA